MHFDVLVEFGGDKFMAYDHAKAWLESIGEKGGQLRQDMCNYCHCEVAPAHIASAIRDKGYYILQMEGCPEAVA